MNCASFPKSAVSPNSVLRFPLRFAAEIVYFRISTDNSWMRHVVVLFEEKPQLIRYGRSVLPLARGPKLAWN